MRHRWLALAAVAAVGVGAIQEVEPGDRDPERPCDLANVQKVGYCARCELYLPPLNDEGKCDICKGEVPTPDVCVKHFHKCGRCGRMQTKAGRC